MMTISRAALPRTSWVRSATRSQLGRSRSCPASGHNVDGGPEKRGSVSDNLWNSKRVIVSCVRLRDQVCASPTEEERGIHGATQQNFRILLRARAVTGVPLRHKHEKSDGTAAWAPILMFARGRAGAKGDVWSGILPCPCLWTSRDGPPTREPPGAQSGSRASQRKKKFHSFHDTPICSRSRGSQFQESRRVLASIAG